MTKVILTKDVPGLGQKDDVKDVKPGYWRNFLLPQSAAVEATPGLLIQTEHKQKERDEKKEFEAKQLTKILADLKGKVLEVTKKADETGSLFDKLDVKELDNLIKEQLRVDIPEGIIKLEKPINKIGTHEVVIGDSKLTVEIKSESAEKSEPKQSDKDKEKKPDTNPTDKQAGKEEK